MFSSLNCRISIGFLAVTVNSLFVDFEVGLGFGMVGLVDFGTMTGKLFI